MFLSSRHTRRRLPAGVVAILVAGAAVANLLAQDEGVQRSFDGDTVRLSLSVGNYRITGSPDDRIRVQPRTKANEISTRITVSLLGNEATLRVTGPKDGADVDIQLPARAVVDVELAAGSLQVIGVQGSKKVVAPSDTIQIAAGAGDLRLRVDNGRITREK